MKPNKSVKARFKVTGTGKLMRRRPGKRHILTKKSSDRKRYLSKDVELDKAHTVKYSRLIGA